MAVRAGDVAVGVVAIAVGHKEVLNVVPVMEVFVGGIVVLVVILPHLAQLLALHHLDPHLVMVLTV